MRYLYNDPSKKTRRRFLRKHETDAEKRLWNKLRNRQLYGIKFYRQFGVGPYILDFYAPSKKLGIELDGSQHGNERHLVHDTKRSAYLKELGITIIRFWDNDVFTNIDGILEVISSRVTPPTLPLS